MVAFWARADQFASLCYERRHSNSPGIGALAELCGAKPCLSAQASDMGNIATHADSTDRHLFTPWSGSAATNQ
jgi:hypothetical protein